MTIERARVGDVLGLDRVLVEPDPTVEYVSIGVRSFGKGIFHYEPKQGDQLGSLRFFKVQPERLVISNIKGWEGAIGVSSVSDVDCIASNRFLMYAPRDGRVDVRWARWYFLVEPGISQIQRASPGSADRNRTLAIERFEELEIPLPPIVEQRRIADRLDRLRATAVEVTQRSDHASELMRALAVSASTRPDLDADAKSQTGWEEIALAEVLTPSRKVVQVEPMTEYLIAGVYSFGRGLINRGSIAGRDTSYKALTALDEGDVVVSKLNGWEGAVAVVGSKFEGYCVSSEFPTFKVDSERLLPAFFEGIAQSPRFWEDLNANARGSMVRRRRINVSEFLATKVWLPPFENQARIARFLDSVDDARTRKREAQIRIEALIPSAHKAAFGGLR